MYPSYFIELGIVSCINNVNKDTPDNDRAIDLDYDKPWAAGPLAAIAGRPKSDPATEATIGKPEIKALSWLPPFEQIYVEFLEKYPKKKANNVAVSNVTRRVESQSIFIFVLLYSLFKITFLLH